jgi:hypothetical protein
MRLLLILLTALLLPAQEFPGYLPFECTSDCTSVILTPRLNEDLLYVASLSAGLGSNDVGLDRGQLGEERIVRFEQYGMKILLIQQNTGYRADTNNADEKRAVGDSFARSVLASFDVLTKSPQGAIRINITNFLLRDAKDVTGTLRQSNQGTWRLDAARSTVVADRTRNFPQNTEFETMLTFAGENAGAFVRSVTPSADAITVRQHHSFIQLPDANYRMRRYDPRSGFLSTSWMDYATAFDQPIRQRVILRHRLQKKDPKAAMSEAIKPITYYVDRGAPEPIRTALLEGARWWNQAFEAAGLRDAFRVEVMPEGADMMDVRYNVIQWVHRSTRGWSYGASIIDPRTGEILKGHVTLGSLRIRQDFLIGEGLMAPYQGNNDTQALRELALARIRQLSMHEVGHTIGLVHNFAASTMGRASAMDYPHPQIDVKADGSLDLSNAYIRGAGEWDKVAINWGYREFSNETEERSGLDRILNDAASRGMYVISDSDSRPPGGAHPASHLWDSGKSAAEELSSMLNVRAIALKRFGENNIRPGTPLASLEDTLVPIYLSHRYQVEASAKVVGGLDYRYALRGDGQQPTALLAPALQASALRELLRTLQPEQLALPESLLQIIPPAAAGYGRTREAFSGRTGITFDALAPVEAAAGLTTSLLLHPERASRLVQQHARSAEQPSLESVIDALLNETWKKMSFRNGMPGEIRRTVDIVALQQLMNLARSERASAQARAIATEKLEELQRWMKAQASAEFAQKAHYRFASAQIERFRNDPKEVSLPRLAEAPPGQPIGCEDMSSEQ